MTDKEKTSKEKFMDKMQHTPAGQTHGRIYPTKPTEVDGVEPTELVVEDAVEISYDTIGEGETQPTTQPPTMIDMVLLEVRRLAAISNVCNDLISNSKTKPKRDLYTKKLKKNNKNLADMLIRLERLNRIEQESEETNE